MINRKFPEVQELLATIESKTHLNMNTASDFEKLQHIAQEKHRVSISLSTLKRMWGYIDGYDLVRTTTLNALAIIAGFKNWPHFTQHIRENNSETISPDRCISTQMLNTGDIITIGWQPNKTCTLLYRGNNLFVVKESRNTKLARGSSFICSLFVKNAPLYLDNLRIRDNDAPIIIKVGTGEGLTLLQKGDINDITE